MIIETKEPPSPFSRMFFELEHSIKKRNSQLKLKKTAKDDKRIENPNRIWR